MSETSQSTSYIVSGMTCGHCVSAVTEELSSLPDVTSVKVDLVPGADSTVVVESAAPLDESVVRAAVDEAGYELTGVRS